MKPDRKITAGALAGAMVMVVAWMTEEFGGVVIPAGVASALTVICTFLVSYIVPNPTPGP